MRVKYVIASVMMILALALAVGSRFELVGTSRPHAAEKTEKVTFAVEGMTCPSCKVTVRLALKKIDGVKEAKVDVDKGLVTVDYDVAKITPERIAQAINEMGYKTAVPEKRS